jgi:hypothetical protein
VGARLSQISNSYPALRRALRPPTSNSTTAHASVFCHTDEALYTSKGRSLARPAKTDPILSHTYVYSQAPTMILRLPWLLVTLVPRVFADVKFTSPAAGATVSGPTISIEWEESGTLPKIADLASYQLFLCAGGNDQSSFVYCPPQSKRLQSLTASRYNSPPL